jgi:hypothetical protein
MNVIKNIKIKQKEWHTATKPLKLILGELSWGICETLHCNHWSRTSFSLFSLSRSDMRGFNAYALAQCIQNAYFLSAALGL